MSTDPMTAEQYIDLRERTTRIETKLDYISAGQPIAVEAKEIGTRAEAKVDEACKDITQLQDSNRWTIRLIAGSLIGVLINTAVNTLQGL